MSVVLVTGCSSGFGEAIAAHLARRGDTVYASMRNPDAASAGLRESGAVVISLDVADAAARAATVERILREQKRFDVLVNNAGIVASGSVEDTPEGASRAVFDTNYFAPVELMRLVLPAMRRQGGGRIVNISAIGAILSTPLLGIYAASKHALDAATAAVDIEGRSFGVRATSVLPGPFRTEIAVKSPARHLTETYAELDAALQRHRARQASAVTSDYGPVIAAVASAIDHPDPAPRYLAGGGLTLSIARATEEMEALHRHELARAGLLQPAS